MTRMVEEQRTQIGTLKALGYKKSAIAAKYICYAFFATLLGSVLGMLIGEKIIPYIIITAYGIMYHNVANTISIDYQPGFALIASAASVVCTVGATLFASGKELQETPASLMRPPAPKEGKRVLLERFTFIWKHLSFSWKSTIRNLFRYKKRLIMTVFGIAGSMGLMLVGFGLQDSISDIAAIQYRELQHYDGMVIEDSDATEEEHEELFEYMKENEQIAHCNRVQMTKISAPKGSSNISIYLFVPESLSEFAKDVTLKNRITGETYELTDEGAAISEKTASLLGLKVGDMIPLKKGDKEYKVRVAVITENYMSHYLYMTPRVYEQTFGEKPEYENIVFTMQEDCKDDLEMAGTRIPYFLDEKHTILMNPFIEYIRAALEMVTKGFSYESVFRYLRCDMSGLGREQVDMLENYVLALGIHGYKKWTEKWVRVYRTMDPEDIQVLNEYREIFVREAEILAQGFSSGKRKVCEYCYSLYQFIASCEIQKKLKKQELFFKEKGDKALEKEYAQIYGIVMELLDRMVEILGEEEITRTEFVQLLETGFAKSKVALIPPSMDQVLVGDMERTRLKEIKALFFVGVNEGNIPKNTDSGGILTQMDREFFADEGMELAPGPKELMNTQRFYLYLNLTKPSEHLCLSYSLSNGKGEPISPAYLIHSIQALYPGLEVKNAGDEEFSLNAMELPGTSLECFLKGLGEGAVGQGSPLYSELYSWYLRSPKYRTLARKLVEASRTRKPADIISESVAKVLYGEVSPYSATRLERYSACAFAHFLQYGLKLTERAEYEFRAMDMGIIMHKVLESLIKEVNKEKLSLAELSEEERDALADRLVDKISADYGNTILKSSARNEYMIQRTKRMVRRTVWAIQKQLKSGEFEPEGVEVVFQGGRIDRVDTMETDDGKLYVRVIDYKTGNTSFDLVSLYHGLQLQLMIYMDGALTVEQNKHKNKEVIPAGVFYYNIKDPMIQEKIDADIETVQEKVLKELKMNGLVLKDKELVQKMDSSLMSIPVSFNKDGSFRKNSSVASKEQFDILNRYVKTKISHIRQSIMTGDAQVSPYMLGKKNACTYCPYSGVCGFDMEIPGYEFRRLKNFTDEELWDAFVKEVDE